MSNKKGFTLIELIVVMTIISILSLSGVTFFRSIIENGEKKEISSKALELSEFLKSIKKSDYIYKEYNETLPREFLNNLDRDKFAQISYRISIIIPILYDITDYRGIVIPLEDIGTFSNTTNLTLGLQMCHLFFDIPTIGPDPTYTTTCDSIIRGSNSFALQSFLLSDSQDIEVSNNGYYITNSGREGSYYEVFLNGINIILNNIINHNDVLFSYFDILLDKPLNLKDNYFVIYNLTTLSGESQQGVYKGDLSTFIDSLSSSYIPGIVNNTLLDIDDIGGDLLNRLNFTLSDFNNINFFYYNPKQIESSYNFLHNISLK